MDFFLSLCQKVVIVGNKMAKKETNTKRSFSIREMEIGDLAEVYELGAANFKPDLWPMLYRGWDEYEVTTLFNTDGEYCLVAENDEDEPDAGNRIVGFILGTVVSKPGSAWTYGYIIWLCSHEAWSREGVAGDLMDELVDIMIENEGIRIIMADTDPDNVRAVNFFNKKGLTDQKPHLYMSSNLEQNSHYRELVLKHRRENTLEKAVTKTKLKKLIRDKPAKSKFEKKKREKKTKKIS